MTRDKRQKMGTGSFDKILAECPSYLFNEQSRFADLTSEQRLDWLNELAYFIYEFKGKVSTL
jgi:hypothetical protein